MYGEYIIPKEVNQADTIGGFTLPQIAIAALGVLISLLLLSSSLSLVISFSISIPLLIFTALLVFKKVHDIPVYEFFMIYIMYRTLPKRLIYRADNFNDDFYEDEEEESLFMVD